MQILFETSEESINQKGLAVIKGAVRKFIATSALKVPHMGWNQLMIKKTDCPLLKGTPDRSYFYFCHSYYADTSDENVVAGSTEYGREFVSMIWKDNIYAFQFHPEKSQSVGLRILKNFVELI
jgi:glutamine amidotransferase